MDERQKLRENAGYRYMTALDQGDLDAVEAVLTQAETDPQLERMIHEVHEAYAEEDEARAAAHVRTLAMAHLPSGQPDEGNQGEPPRLTVGDVLAHLVQRQALEGRVPRELVRAADKPGVAERPLPHNLNARAIQQFLQHLGVSLGKSLEKRFQELAVSLSMGREQGRARMAAARRQREMRQQSASEEEKR